MNEAERNLATAAAFGVGILALMTAVIVALLRGTRGLPIGQRIVAMARLIQGAIWAAAPPMWVVASVTIGVLAFILTMATGLALTILIIWMFITPKVPPAEAHEGIGDAFSAIFCFVSCGMVSFFAAAIIGILAGARVASRWEQTQVESVTFQE